MKIDIIDDRDDDPLPTRSLRDLAEVVLGGESLSAGTEVSITFVDRDEITRLNETRLGRPGPTDVLSFPIEDLSPGSPPVRHEGDPPLMLGDVVICPDVVAANATEHRVAFEDEMALMVVHGLLHLLGYDHVDDGDAELMEARERTHLAEVGRTRR